jgi:oligoribonuclease NrnB/cAMP/cGMP phosphodiesterase (DHH superfamily)
MEHIPKLCIYHGDCLDGFTAAWVVDKAHDSIEFHAGKYGEVPPDCSGMDVILVDFSYPRDVMVKIANEANSVLVIDHHKTAQANLVNLPGNVTLVFDMEKSGARLTFEFFFPLEPVPDLVAYVEDRDLWRFNLEGTEAFNTMLATVPHTFKDWSGVADMSPEDAAKFLIAGALIRDAHLLSVNRLIDSGANIETFEGYEVPFLNAPYFYASDAGSILAKGHPFAVTFYISDGYANFSLRSSDEGEDVSKIAEKFGGGGHRNAAGFRIKRSEGMSLIFTQKGETDASNSRHR